MRGKGYYKAAKGDNGSKKNVNLKNRKYARGRYIIKNRNVEKTTCLNSKVRPLLMR